MLVHYVPIALALDFDLALDEDQAVAHHLEVAPDHHLDHAHHLEVALDLDGDLAPVNLCSGATGCCGTGKQTPPSPNFLTLTAKLWQIF